MDIVHPRVAGIDVHKKVVWVAVRLPGERPGERTVTVKRFKTFWRPLRQMAAWLSGLGVTDAALESTGVYWWPVYHALAGAGIDVHKKVIWVAVRLPGGEPGERRVLVKSFRTFWRQLRQMAGWLAELGVTDAAMESTGVYWWPVYHALAQAGQIEVCVANAAHMRNVPGRKTDLRDCQWIAELHEHGLLRPSFIPTAEVAALRQRTRYRKKLIEQRAAEGQRLSKVLEDAGIKTGIGGLGAAGRIGPGDDRGAGRRGAGSAAAGRAGEGPAAGQAGRAGDGL